MILSDNGISKVEHRDKWVYKTQPKFMTDNEIWILELLYPFGYIPYAEQTDIETIRLEFIEETQITYFDVVQWHFRQVLKMLRDNSIRHGDLTRPNILIKNNYPYVIDWSESRLGCDPRPDKRREGDEHWLKRTFDELAK